MGFPIVSPETTTNNISIYLHYIPVIMVGLYQPIRPTWGPGILQKSQSQSPLRRWKNSTSKALNTENAS